MKRVLCVLAVMTLLSGRIAAAEEKIDQKALEKIVDNALKAYNDDDHKRFFEDFAKAVDALKNKETYDALYTNGYKKAFGKFVARGDLIKEKTLLRGEVGAAFWKAEFEKNKKAYVAVNWMLEDKKIKLIQLQIHFME